MAHSERAHAATSTLTTGRDRAASTPESGHFHAALPRAMRALRSPRRGVLQAQLRSALSELAEDMYRSLAGREDTPQPPAPRPAAVQEQARHLRSVLAAAEPPDQTTIAASECASSAPEATRHDDLAFERLSVEHRSLRTTYEWTRARLDAIEHAQTDGRTDLACELDAARAAHVRTRTELDAERQRAEALVVQLAETRADAARQAAQLRSLSADHAALHRLLTQLVSGLGAADAQLRVLLERQGSLMAATSPASTAARQPSTLLER